MPSPLARRRLGAAALAVLALVASYAALGYLVAPSLVGNALVERARQAGYDVRFRAIHTHPFLLVVDADDVRVATASGARLLYAQRASVDLGWASLWRRRWVIDGATIHGGTVTAPEAPRLENLELQARGEEFSATATLAGGRAQTRGRFSVEPLGLAGDLALRDARLAFAWRYLPPSFGEAPAGRLGGTVAYRYAGGRLFLSQADVRAQVDGGTLAVQGELATAPFAARLHLDAERLPLSLARRFVEQRFSRRESPVRVARGTVSAKGALQLGARSRYEGSASLADVRVEDAEGGLLVAWQSLATAALRVDFRPLAVHVADAAARAPHVRAVIAPDGTLNLAAAFLGGNGAKEEKAPSVAVDRLTIADGRLDFADRSLDTPFATSAGQLAGAVTELATGSAQPARVELAGRVGRYGEAHVRGVIDLEAPATRTNLALTFRNLALPDFTPYAAKFAGYRIAAGRLDAELRYRVRDGRLVGDNRLAFEHLQLGDKVRSDRKGAGSALDVPLDLAVALLTDAQGRIDLAIPVRGDLRDPQVDFGGLLAKALRNTLGRVVSAPFRALASLLGAGEDDQLGTVRFAPGAAALSPAEEDTVAQLARALAERPRLSLTVHGAYEAQADREALQRAALLREVAKRAGYAAAAGGGAPAGIDLRDPRLVHAAERLFLDRGGRTSDLAPLKPHERGYGRRLVDALAARTPVAADAGPALARARAQAIRDALVRDGVDARRVSIGEPVEARSDAQSTEAGVPVSLALAGR